MTKFAIGTLVQWHESGIIGEYIDSLIEAVNEYSGKIIIDFYIVKPHEKYEHFNGDKKDLDKCIKEIKNKLSKLDSTITIVPGIYSISKYRQKFNTDFCEKADVLVWGEPDMLMPKQAFTILDYLHKQVNIDTPKYLATFATSKMWDKTWEPLEHIDFTNKEFDGESDDNWWSLKYTMSKEEMNKINSKVEDLKVTLISPHKFQGCGLAISSEVIKSGVNIPKSVFFVHEDTAFMHMTNKILGNIPQYHFKNILMVHNRKHPKKMSNVVGKDKFNKYAVGKLREENEWYNKAFQMSLQNSNNIFNPKYKSYSWEDVWK